MNIKKLLGKKIKKLRLNHSLTQEELAEKINLSPKSLSQIELGNNFVSAETLEYLCSALDVNPKILFDFENQEMNREDAVSEIVSKLNQNSSLTNTLYKIVMALDN